MPQIVTSNSNRTYRTTKFLQKAKNQVLKELLLKGEYRHVFKTLKILQSNKNTVQFKILVQFLRSCHMTHLVNITRSHFLGQQKLYGPITTLMMKTVTGDQLCSSVTPSTCFTVYITGCIHHSKYLKMKL